MLLQSKPVSISPLSSPPILLTRRRIESIQTQLLELEGMLSSAGNDELVELQACEDAKLEAIARERRKKIAEVQRGYDEQLEEFQKERVKLLVAQGGGPGGKGKRRAVVPAGKGLEKVAITTDEAAGWLEDFFGGGEHEEEATSTSDSRGKGEGKGKQYESKPAAPAKKKGNHAILADEDIDDDEEMMAFYGR